MKPLLSTLDSGNRDVCENNEAVCKFMEPIMIFDIHSWASTKCAEDLKDKLKTLSGYGKFELMRENCKGHLKKSWARRGLQGQTFLTDFDAAKELIEKEQEALQLKAEEIGVSVLQRYNEVAIRLWPWDIVGIEVGKDLTIAESLRDKLDGRRKELKEKLKEFLQDSRREIIQESLDDKNVKIFLKFLEHQHSREERKEEKPILNQVPKDVWSFLLQKIIARLEAPLKMLHYDINYECSSSILVENPDEKLEHICRGLQQEKKNGLFNVYPKSVEG
jgi:hypothetical protein